MLKKFEFVPVWEAMNTPLEVEVKNFWAANNAMPPEMADERATCATVVVRNERKELIGLSTAKRVRLKLLNDNHFFEVRCFIAEKERQPGLETKLMMDTKKYLYAYRLDEGINTLGLVVVIESEKLKKMDQGFLARSGLLLCRIYYERTPRSG